MSRRGGLRPVIFFLGVATVSVGLFSVVGWLLMIRMPGRSFHGVTPRLTPDEMTLREELIVHVHKLADEIGERNLPHYPRLLEAAQYVETHPDRRRISGALG